MCNYLSLSLSPSCAFSVSCSLFFTRSLSLFLFNLRRRHQNQGRWQQMLQRPFPCCSFLVPPICMCVSVRL